MTRPILYLSGPYIPHRELPADAIRSLAEHHLAAAEEAGWRPICPSVWGGTTAPQSGMAILQRLDVGTDAVLMLPDWTRDAHAVLERQWASARGLAIYQNDRPIPPPGSSREGCDHRAQRDRRVATKKQKIELGADLCAALQVLSKKAPLEPGERPTYDKTVRWILRTHPHIAPQVVDELTL